MLTSLKGSKEEAQTQHSGRNIHWLCIHASMHSRSVGHGVGSQSDKSQLHAVGLGWLSRILNNKVEGQLMVVLTAYLTAFLQE